MQHPTVNLSYLCKFIIYFRLCVNKICYLCKLKLRKRSKLLRMNNDLLVEYVLGYELAIYRVFWFSAFCITSNNSFCIAKVLIFSHFTKNSQRKIPFRRILGKAIVGSPISVTWMNPDKHLSDLWHNRNKYLRLLMVWEHTVSRRRYLFIFGCVKR